jgi:adenylate kinase family enzyme
MTLSDPEARLPQVRDIVPGMNSKPHVLLLAGPGGAGKTSTAARIAQHPRWEHVSEDDYWIKIKQGHPWGELRTSQEQRIVQNEVMRRVIDLATGRKNVVLEFILYEDPPHPLLNYQSVLASHDIPFTSRILRTSADAVLQRMKMRGRRRDTDLDKRRAQAEHQLRCLASPYIQDDWLIDTSDISLEEVYARHLQAIVEDPKGS